MTRELPPNPRVLASLALQGIAAGLLAGCACPALIPDDEPPRRRAPKEVAEPTDRNCCKGRNDCKGKGNCKVEASHECKGQNECKGTGGCRSSDCAAE